MFSDLSRLRYLLQKKSNYYLLLTVSVKVCVSLQQSQQYLSLCILHRISFSTRKSFTAVNFLMKYFALCFVTITKGNPQSKHSELLVGGLKLYLQRPIQTILFYSCQFTSSILEIYQRLLTKQLFTRWNCKRK